MPTDFKSLSEEALKSTLTEIVNNADTPSLVAFAHAIAELPSVPEIAQKNYQAGIKFLAEYGPKRTSENPANVSDLVNALINSCSVIIASTTEAAKVHPRFKIALLTCQVFARETISFAFEVTQRFNEAARALAEMPLDQGLPSYDENYKFSLYVMLAELHLKGGSEIQAENYLNTARPLERDSKIEQGARDRFNLCYAKVLDSSKKFVEAANRYFLVSSGVEEVDALEALRRATVCATMAEPSVARNRVLGALYRDERRAKLGDVGQVVEKLFYQRVLRKIDIDALKPLLLPQHQSVGADKTTTAFDLAITRHNIVSASKIYSSITFEDLGALLGTDSEQAESLVAQMAAQGRISATIDQLEGYVSFVGNAAIPILRWDSQIDSVGNLIATVAETIIKRHPELEPKGGL